MTQNAYHFFMSATTSGGFVSNFGELVDENRYKRVYLIKGGAGSGKSTLIKKAAEKASLTQNRLELIHCSADPDSLDAAILGDTTILDATFPHMTEPCLPGVFERMVTLYDCFDNAVLRQNETDIRRALGDEEINKSRADSFIRAAGLLLYSNESIAARCINSEKLSGFIARLCMREIKKAKTYKSEQRKRYLSALSGDGVFMFTDTAQKLCSRLFVINDDNGAVSGIILDGLLRAALSAGHIVYSCACPLSKSGRIEHLFIPELSLGFMTSNKFHPIELSAAKTIHTSRFLDKEKMRQYSYRTSFQRKAARELLKEAAGFLSRRLSAHKRLEEFYAQACNDSLRKEVCDSVLAEF